MINESEIARIVRRTLDGYFRDLDGEKPTAIYDMVISCVEKPLIEVNRSSGHKENDHRVNVTNAACRTGKGHSRRAR